VPLDSSLLYARKSIALRPGTALMLAGTMEHDSGLGYVRCCLSGGICVSRRIPNQAIKTVWGSGNGLLGLCGNRRAE